MRIKNKIFHKLIAMISVMAIFVSSVAPIAANALTFDLTIKNMIPTGGLTHREQKRDTSLCVPK